ncbi:hypothetical protein [Salimicrobium halophilum]|uniref:Uncharacterized protein n=1 Tax=Salimicrobium halophilum TaxID=86666 RepID=A0A1G8Q263_9BACI|nr:hypothetical protein [Salimicrobium halophilum]SDI98844.1 hypothetical protein SAMN04490247_0352 [Salimicrobium halophilum]
MNRETEWEQRIRHFRKSLSTLETTMDESVHEEMEGYRENLRYMVKETKEKGRFTTSLLHATLDVEGEDDHGLTTIDNSIEGSYRYST